MLIVSEAKNCLIDTNQCRKNDYKKTNATRYNYSNQFSNSIISLVIWTSSKGMNLLSISWYFSCPLPNINKTSFSFNNCTPLCIASATTAVENLITSDSFSKA